MPRKFRWRAGDGPWNYVDANLPYNIDVDADQAVTVEPIGLAAAIEAPLRAVSNRVFMMQTQGPVAQSAERAIAVAELFDDVNGKIEFFVANYRAAEGVEIPAGAPITDGAAQIRYTSRTTGTTVVVSAVDAVTGSNVLTADDGGYLRAIGTIDALKGTKVTLEQKNTNTKGAIFSQFKSDLANGDRYQFGGAVGALGSAGVQTDAITWRGPCLIRAVTAKPVAVIVGDSNGDGLYDVADSAKGDIGAVPRLLGSAGVPHVNLSSRGDYPEKFLINSARRVALAAEAGGSCAFLQSAINAFNQGHSAEKVEADNQAIADLLGLPAVWVTPPAFTVGGPDNPWNADKEAQRQLYLDICRSKPAYIDFDHVLCTPQGGWRNEDAVAPDFLHLSNVGAAYAAQHAPIVGTSLAVHGIAPRAAGPVMPGKGPNLFIGGRSINNGNWNKFAGTVATGRRASEFGNTAEAFLELATTAAHRFLPAAPISMSTGTYELEADLAYHGYQWVQVELSGGNAFIALDIQNGVIGTIYNANEATFAFTGGVVSNIGNGFRRYKLTIEVNAGATPIYPAFGTTTGNLSGASHAGDTAKGMLVRPIFYLRKL